MSQIIHGPPKIWGPGNCPICPPLKPALFISIDYSLQISKILIYADIKYRSVKKYVLKLLF